MSDPPKRNFLLGSVVFVSCVLAGASVLFVSTWLVGSREFQESNKHVYFFCLFATGAVAGGVCPRSWWTCWLGVYAGQSITFALTPTPHPNAFLGTRFRGPFILQLGEPAWGCGWRAVASRVQPHAHFPPSLLNPLPGIASASPTCLRSAFLLAVVW